MPAKTLIVYSRSGHSNPHELVEKNKKYGIVRGNCYGHKMIFSIVKTPKGGASKAKVWTSMGNYHEDTETNLANLRNLITHKMNGKMDWKK